MNTLGDPTAVAEVPVSGECDISRARVVAAGLAAEAGFSRAAIYRLATAVSELSTNLVFHASAGGTIRLTLLKRGPSWGIEVTAEDKGPGIADVELAMRDGYSTNGGLGSGLPGCRRLMDEFQIASEVGRGTTVVARIWS